MNKRSAEEAKQNILAAARRVFVERGYDQASIRNIACTAGISVGCVYLYFKSKEELFRTLMLEWMVELNAATVAALDVTSDARQAVAEFVRVTVEFADRRRDMILLQGRESGFSFGLDLKKQFFRERRAWLARIIRKGIDEGVFGECDAEEAAKVVFCALRGYVLSMCIDQEALFTPEACATLVLGGLIRRKPE